MPDARVVLENPGTNTVIAATTDQNGRYRFENVAAGRYRIRIGSGPNAPYQEYEVAGGGSAGRVDLTYDSGKTNGAARTDGILSAEVAPIEIHSAQIRNHYNTQFVQYLPGANLLNNDGSAFGGYNLSLTGEAVTTGAGVARGPAVAGVQPISNNFRVDGIDNNNKAFPGPLTYVPNEASQSFTLFQGQAKPVFGHSAGGNFETIARSGANEFHGAIYNYFQNRHLNSLDNSFKRIGVDDRPRYDQNRLGASAGFPILPGKIFFFGNFEYIPLGFARPIADAAFAPTQAGFTQLARTPGVSATNLGILQRTFGDVSLGTSEDDFRAATIRGQEVALAPVTGVTRGWQNQWIGTGALDFNLTNTNQLKVRYVHNELESSPFGNTLPASGRTMNSTALMANAGLYQTFTPSLTNELRLGYSRWYQRFGENGDGIDPGIEFPGLSSFPNIQIGGVNNLRLGPQTGLFESSAFNTYQLADALAWNLGAHELRFGGDALRYVSSLRNAAAMRANFFFSSLERFLLDLPPDVLAQQSFGSSAINDNRWLVTGWINDTWQASPNLTINAGLRYQWSENPAFLRAAGLNRVAGREDVLDLDLDDFFDDARLDTDNFAPQAGFAWAPGGSRTMVVRAGFAMNYDMLHNPWVYLGLGQASPAVGTTITRTSLGSTPGFFRAGAIRNPYPDAGTENLTEQQARALTSAFVAGEPNPYTMSWNAGVEQSLWNRATAGLKYLGSRSVHQPMLGAGNFSSPVTARNSLPLFFSRPTQAQLNQLQLTLNQLQAPQSNPFTQAGFTNPILTVSNSGNISYHALAATFNQRLAGGFQILGNWTWGHMVSDFTGAPLDLNFGRQRADSLYDRRHRVSLTGMFDVAPLFENLGSIARNIFANVNISGTYTFQTGAWMPALSGANTGLTPFGAGSAAILNPDGTGLSGTDVTPLANSAGQVVGYLANDPNARFIRGAPGLHTIGMRNAFQLDPVNNIDLAVVKRFSWRDRFAFEVRGEAYNLANHSQYTGVPINSFSFQSLNGLSSFFVPGTGSFADPSGFFTNNPRVVQLALRVSF